MWQFLIAPDVPPACFSGWHMFNTLLQRHTGRRVRLLMPADGEEAARLCADGLPDLAYVGAFEAAGWMRGHGYVPVVRPADVSEEVVVATYRSAPYRHSDELPPGCRILAAASPDVRVLGLCLLGSAGLDADNVFWLNAATVQAAARRLIGQEADAAFFPASAYAAFNDSTKRKMTVLMASRLDDLHRVLLLHPQHAAHCEEVAAVFVRMGDNAAGRRVLADLGVPLGFERLGQEAAEWMIDLTEALRH